MIKLNSFINMFHQLWKAGDTAHLNLDTQAGEAWVGLRVQLGKIGQPLLYPPQSPTYRSPSYYRRQERRKAAKAADAYGMFEGHDVELADGESAYTQALRG